MKEKFKDFNGYKVGNKGTIVGKSGKIIKDQLVNNRNVVTINRTNIRKSYLIAKLFLKNPKNKPHVYHKNGNILDDSSENLRYTYQKEFSEKRIKGYIKQSKSVTGKKSHVSRPFKINRRKFYTLREASEYLGIRCLDTIKKRLVNKIRKDYCYINK
jgi:hypothetical protein